MGPTGRFTAFQPSKIEPMKTKPETYLSCVESPYKGADLLRKLMEVALSRGHLRRYFSLRRAWARAIAVRREGGAS